MQFQKLPGLNVQTPWARLLLEGKKTIETRTYPLPTKYQSRDLWLIETPGKLGRFKARVIGTIKFSSCHEYISAEQFYLDSDHHLVFPETPYFAWKNGTPKYGWIVEAVKYIEAFDPPMPRGIVYSKPFDQQLGMT